MIHHTINRYLSSLFYLFCYVQCIHKCLVSMFHLYVVSLLLNSNVSKQILFSKMIFPLQNLLFTDDSPRAELKLVDFGFAKRKGSQPLQTPCFTLSYAAPEILQNATGEAVKEYDESVDIWSLGVIFVSACKISYLIVVLMKSCDTG